MTLFALKILKWLASKSVVLIAAAALVIGVFAFWMFARESFLSDEGSREALATMESEDSALYGQLEATRDRLAELGNEIEQSRQRLEAANRAIEYLDGILKRIGRFLTLTAAERAAAERDLEAARAEKENQARRMETLVAEQSRLRLDRVALTEEAKALATRISESDRSTSRFVQYVDRSWTTLKPYLIAAIAGAILIPILWKLFAYFAWAPLLSAAGPMRLVKHDLPLPTLADSGVSIQLKLGEGQRAWIKESYLQASDESLRRRTRFVLNWAIPATCLAAGLVELVELEGGAAAPGRVTVSPQRRPELEIALIEIGAGGQMIARPSCIAGAVSRDGSALSIKRRWRIFHPQAWLTFQFRYFVFQGPCALIVAGVRGVRYEALETQSDKGRRTNQVATIGFTPDLAYGVTRAETFWSYFRGFNPLFDDVFRGRGVFLCQEISDREATGAGRFWSGFWNGALKLLGI